MKKILCLGGAGFIGSYIVRELLAHGFAVEVVDNFSKYGFVQHDFYDHPNFTLKNKDVRNMYPREYAGFDAVLCLAALIGGIKYFHRIPYQIARDNTELLSCAIDATLAAAPQATFVYFSSSMIYERMNRPVTEDDALTQPVPITNYGMQKLFGEFLTRGAHEEYGLRYAIVRPFNAVGSGELPDVKTDGTVDFGMAHVIPDFVYKSMIKQTPFEIFGDGQQVRTFTHARDIAVGVRLLLETNTVNEDINFCGTTSLDMNELARSIWQRINPDAPFPQVASMPIPPSDVRFRIGTSEKARRLLNWEPRYTLTEIIDDTAAHIKRHFANTPNPYELAQ